jgi:riboflavin synthase
LFTGLVEEVGRLDERRGERFRFTAQKVLDGSDVGASIAVNGTCLTLVAKGDGWWEADISPETESRSTVRDLRVGDPVNMERAVRMSDRLGGHVMQGHVDGVGEVLAPVPDLRVRIPSDLMRYCVEKGSIGIDGVSLTIFGLDGDSFTVAVIPHTAEVTTLGQRRPGDRVNIEVDMAGKYFERLLSPYVARLGDS